MFCHRLILNACTSAFPGAGPEYACTLGGAVIGFALVAGPLLLQALSSASAASAVPSRARRKPGQLNAKRFMRCSLFMVPSSRSHAVHGGLGKHLLQLVAARFEAAHHARDLGSIG